jgi:hypothetical protein
VQRATMVRYLQAPVRQAVCQALDLMTANQRDWVVKRVDRGCHYHPFPRGQGVACQTWNQGPESNLSNRRPSCGERDRTVGEATARIAKKQVFR